jgi:hypothetical protein
MAVLSFSVSRNLVRKANLNHIKQFESTYAFCNNKNTVLTYQAHEGSFQYGETFIRVLLMDIFQ